MPEFEHENPYHVMTREIYPDVLAEWEERRQDYGEAFLELGAKGQYSELHRKMAKLKKGVWEGEELHNEDAEQVARECIPHLLMMIYCLQAKL